MLSAVKRLSAIHYRKDYFFLPVRIKEFDTVRESLMWPNWPKRASQAQKMLVFSLLSEDNALL